MKCANVLRSVPKAISVFAMLGGLWFSTALWAGPVPLGFTQGSCGLTYKSVGCSLRNGVGSASADLSGLTATVQMSGDATHAGTGAESVIYYFQFLSGSGYDYSLVPLLVTSTLVTSMGGGGSFNHSNASASYSVGGWGQGACSGWGCAGLPATYAGTETIWLGLSSWVYAVSVQVSAEVNSDGPTSAYAFADPYIEIDPAYLNTHPGLSLSFSSNITNSPPNPGPHSVPTPTTISLFAAGLLGLLTSRKMRS